MSKKLSQHTEAGICPLTRQSCIGDRCKFWQTYSTFQSERTSLDLCDFLSQYMPAAERTEQLSALLRLQHDMAELAKKEEKAGRSDAGSFERYEHCKSERILLCEKLEAEIKRICLNQGFEFISCSINAEAESTGALGKVHYLGRGPDEGDCLLAMGAIYADIA
jgi:hypothetical protein